jgi:type IV secretory pathway ATPase VirB11/archaellum biosynthesis ATPase
MWRKARAKLNSKKEGTAGCSTSVVTSPTALFDWLKVMPQTFLDQTKVIIENKNIKQQLNCKKFRPC